MTWSVLYVSQQFLFVCGTAAPVQAALCMRGHRGKHRTTQLGVIMLRRGRRFDRITAMRLTFLPNDACRAVRTAAKISVSGCVACSTSPAGSQAFSKVHGLTGQRSMLPCAQRRVAKQVT
jgi:hypothetical protein